jgi:3-hydroxyacyl-[acyl-carrier-protein] dehydratase
MRLEYFQMVDRITELDIPGARIATACQVPEQSPVFEGHFPGYPILPGVLMIETMAQTGGWLVLATLRCAKMPFLMQVEKAKMRAFISPGQALRAEATLLHEGSGYAVVKATITAGGKKVTEAEIRYGVVPFPNETLQAAMVETARRIGMPADRLPATEIAAEHTPNGQPPGGQTSNGQPPGGQPPGGQPPGGQPPGGKPSNGPAPEGHAHDA